MSRVVAKRMYGHLGISEIDHINSDPLDNRRENLRLCSRSENNRNKTKRRNKKSSIYKGVFFKSSYKYKKGYCEIRLKKENIRKTKYFKTEKEAAIQYNEWAKELHKDFACLNDINT